MHQSKSLGERQLAIWRRQQHLVRALERAISRLLFRNRKLHEANRQLRRLALTDPLTGLPNRRAIEEAAQHEIDRRQRHPSPLALGLVDADHFREINRRYLHPGGDQALIGLTQALTGSLRSSDRVGRIGGEEFLVLALQTDLAGATALAERLRAAVAQTPIQYNGQTIAVTVSIGFAVVETGTPADFQELKHLAAEALAKAKSAGRDCAVIRLLNGDGASSSAPAVAAE